MSKIYPILLGLLIILSPCCAIRHATGEKLYPEENGDTIAARIIMISEIQWRRTASILIDTAVWKLDFGEVELFRKLSQEQKKYSITNRPVQDSLLNRFIEREFFIKCQKRFAKLNSKHQELYVKELLRLIRKENLSSPYRYVAYWMQAVVSFHGHQYDDADRWLNLAINTCMQVHEHWDLGEMYALASVLAVRQNDPQKSYRFLNLAIECCNTYKTADILYRNMPDEYAVKLPESGDALEAYMLSACESLIHYYNNSQNESRSLQHKELIEKYYFHRCHELYKHLPLADQLSFINHVDSLVTRYSMQSPYKVLFDVCVAAYNDSIWNLDLSREKYQHIYDEANKLPHHLIGYTDSLALRSARFRLERVKMLQGYDARYRRLEELDSINSVAKEGISKRLWLEEYPDYVLGYYEAAMSAYQQQKYEVADSLLNIYFGLCENPNSEVIMIGFPEPSSPIEPAMNQSCRIGYYLGEDHLIGRLSGYRQYQATNIAKYILALPEIEREYAWNRMVGQLNHLHNASLLRYPLGTIAEAVYDNALHTRILSLSSSRLMSRLAELPKIQQQDSLVRLNTWHWQDLASRLDSTEAAIELVESHPIDDPKGEATYYALILKGQVEYPQVVELCQASALDTLLCESQLGNAKNIDRLYTWEQQGANLYELCIAPIFPYLQDVHTIYIAKTGSFNQININAIPCSLGQRMMDRYQILNVSTTSLPLTHRELQNPISIATACIYGGLDYYTKTTKDSSTLFRDDRDGLLYLVNSRIEADTISYILQKQGCQTVLYKGADGTEESVKALDGYSPDLLHFATHSFYLRDDSIRQERLTPVIETLSRKMRPLRYTGLHLANSAPAWFGAQQLLGDEDGLLTAEEISNLDLSHTKLVVLSACSSGMGQMDKVDGVIGLQHAFKRAGVQTIVLSLWPVPDETTQLLMQYFYTNLMIGENCHQALIHAMQTLRQNPRYEKPHYWAGFVVLD